MFRLKCIFFQGPLGISIAGGLGKRKCGLLTMLHPCSPHPYSSIIQFLAKCTPEDDLTARVQSDKDARQRYEYELNVAEDDGAGN